MAPRIVRALIFASAFLSGTARADWFAVLVAFSCEAKANLLSVQYLGGYNERAQELIDQQGPNAWVPSWITKHSETGTVLDEPWITRTCRLSDGVYTVRIKPVAGAGNVQLSCGVSSTARVVIARSSNQMLDLLLDEDQCSSNESRLITTRITIRGGSHEVQTEQLTAREFMRF
jgi:hypothetical protein